MLSRISSSLKPHHDPSFKVEFDQKTIRSAGSVVEGVIRLTLDDQGGAGGTGRKAFSELRVKFGAVQVSPYIPLSPFEHRSDPEIVRRVRRRRTKVEPNSRARISFSFLHLFLALSGSTS